MKTPWKTTGVLAAICCCWLPSVTVGYRRLQLRWVSYGIYICETATYSVKIMLWWKARAPTIRVQNITTLYQSESTCIRNHLAMTLHSTPGSVTAYKIRLVAQTMNEEGF